MFRKRKTAGGCPTVFDGYRVAQPIPHKGDQLYSSLPQRAHCVAPAALLAPQEAQTTAWPGVPTLRTEPVNASVIASACPSTAMISQTAQAMMARMNSQS